MEELKQGQYKLYDDSSFDYLLSWAPYLIIISLIFLIVMRMKGVRREDNSPLSKPLNFSLGINSVLAMGLGLLILLYLFGCFEERFINGGEIIAAPIVYVFWLALLYFLPIILFFMILYILGIILYTCIERMRIPKKQSKDEKGAAQAGAIFYLTKLFTFEILLCCILFVNLKLLKSDMCESGSSGIVLSRLCGK